jgi:transcriptional regulator with XRE-family HTH domain
MTFGERLRELREQAGLTQERLAYKSAMSIGSIRNYEQGIREPYWKGVFQLAEALGVDCSAFKVCVGAEPVVKPAPAKKRKEK